MSKATSPSHQTKVLWKSATRGGRQNGESLKQFARRQTDETAPVAVSLTCYAWLMNKKAGPRFMVNPSKTGLEKIVRADD